MFAKRVVGSITFVVALVVSTSAATRRVEHPVTYWNDVTAAAATVGRAGPSALLDIALVQLAVHDAVQAIERKYEPYLFRDGSATGSYHFNFWRPVTAIREGDNDTNDACCSVMRNASRTRWSKPWASRWRT